MKVLYGFVLCLLLAGCQNPPARLHDHVQVTVEGGGVFPPALAGRWQANRQGWQMVLKPDGRIASAILSLGRVEVTPGIKTTVPTQGGGHGTFEPGTWTVQYEPATKQLSVKIEMAHVRVEMGGNVLEGKSTDVFSGAVSAADGVWQAQWSTFTRYKVHTAEGGITDLSTDSTYGQTEGLTFQRMPQP